MSAADLNPQLIVDGNQRVQRLLDQHLTLVEQSRASEEESEALLAILSEAEGRCRRWLALVHFNQELHRLRDGIAEGRDKSALPSKAQLMQHAVEAGLGLDRANRLIQRAVGDGKTASGEFPTPEN